MKREEIVLHGWGGQVRKLVRIDASRWKLTGDLRLLRMCDLSDDDRTHLRWFDLLGGPLVPLGAILQSQTGKRYRVDERSHIEDEIIVETSEAVTLAEKKGEE